MELKDYLHLYLGCQVMLWTEATNPNFKPEKRKLVIEDGRYSEITLKAALFCGAKPILRPLTDMTEEEEAEYMKLEKPEGYKFRLDMRREAARTAYLLSNGFDVFGLIEKCLAIDATNLKSVS